MATPSEPDRYSKKDVFKTPCHIVSSSIIEDSGYLSQGSCSPFNETHNTDVGSSNSGSLQATYSQCSISCDDAIFSPVNSMEIDDLSLGKDFAKTQVPTSTFLKLSESHLGVWQSTPANKRLCKNVHKEFDFVTPLPGPSSNMPCRTASLNGHRHVDILSRLAQRKMIPPLHKILSFLEPADLCQLRLVSSSWRKLLNTFPQVKEWQHFVKVRQQNKENSLLNIVKSEEFQDVLVTPVTSRGQLRDIHNLVPAKQSNQSPPVSPSKLHSSRYIKEGLKLKSGEKLRKCPKCAWPARADKNKLGFRCTGRLCCFHFCMDCSGPFHENTPCANTTPVTPTKARPRIHKNKKRLHRLLL